MITQWRLFLTALRFCTRLPAANRTPAEAPPIGAAVRFLPLVGAAVGAVGGGVYWFAAQVWPTSVAVVLVDAGDGNALGSYARHSGYTGRRRGHTGRQRGHAGQWRGHTGPCAWAVRIRVCDSDQIQRADGACRPRAPPFPLPANVSPRLDHDCRKRRGQPRSGGIGHRRSAQAASKPATMLGIFALALALGFLHRRRSWVCPASSAWPAAIVGAHRRHGAYVRGASTQFSAALPQQIETSTPADRSMLLPGGACHQGVYLTLRVPFVLLFVLAVPAILA